MRVAVSTTRGPACLFEGDRLACGPGPGVQDRVLRDHVETIAEDGVSDRKVGDALADSSTTPAPSTPTPEGSGIGMPFQAPAEIFIKSEQKSHRRLGR